MVGSVWNHQKTSPVVIFECDLSAVLCEHDSTRYILKFEMVLLKSFRLKWYLWTCLIHYLKWYWLKIWWYPPPWNIAHQSTLPTVFTGSTSSAHVDFEDMHLRPGVYCLDKINTCEHQWSVSYRPPPRMHIVNRHCINGFAVGHGALVSIIKSYLVPMVDHGGSKSYPTIRTRSISRDPTHDSHPKLPRDGSQWRKKCSMLMEWELVGLL